MKNKFPVKKIKMEGKQISLQLELDRIFFHRMEELVEDCSEEKSENNSEAAAGVAEDSAKKISLELDSENLSSQQVGRKIKISTRKH